MWDFLDRHFTELLVLALFLVTGLTASLIGNGDKDGHKEKCDSTVILCGGGLDSCRVLRQ